MHVISTSYSQNRGFEHGADVHGADVHGADVQGCKGA